MADRRSDEGSSYSGRTSQARFVDEGFRRLARCVADDAPTKSAADQLGRP